MSLFLNILVSSIIKDKDQLTYNMRHEAKAQTKSPMFFNRQGLCRRFWATESLLLDNIFVYISIIL